MMAILLHFPLVDKNAACERMRTREWPQGVFCCWYKLIYFSCSECSSSMFCLFPPFSFFFFFSSFLFYVFDPFLFLLLQLFKLHVDNILCFLLRMTGASLEMAVVLTSTQRPIYFLCNSNTIYILKSVLSCFKFGLHFGHLVFCAKMSTFLFLQVGNLLKCQILQRRTEGHYMDAALQESSHQKYKKYNLKTPYVIRFPPCGT